MIQWEGKQSITKNNYGLARQHFKYLVKAYGTYVQNISDGTAGRNKYERANNMAKIGNKIKDYIAKIASALITNNDALANICNTDRTNNLQIKAMSTQLKLLADTVALLTKSIKPGDKNHNPNSRGCSCKARGDQNQQLTKLHNMGGYCHTNGYHSIGSSHDSNTCNIKKEGDCNGTTYNNRLDGNTYWPAAIRVAIKQQNHAPWKDKSKPI